MKEIYTLHNAGLAAFMISCDLPEVDHVVELQEILSSMLDIIKKIALKEDIDLKDLNDLTIISLDRMQDILDRGTYGSPEKTKS
jgi:hypothetical protein